MASLLAPYPAVSCIQSCPRNVQCSKCNVRCPNIEGSSEWEGHSSATHGLHAMIAAVHSTLMGHHHCRTTQSGTPVAWPCGHACVIWRLWTATSSCTNSTHSALVRIGSSISTNEHDPLEKGTPQAQGPQPSREVSSSKAQQLPVAPRTCVFSSCRVPSSDSCQTGFACDETGASVPLRYAASAHRQQADPVPKEP